MSKVPAAGAGMPAGTLIAAASLLLPPSPARAVDLYQDATIEKGITGAWYHDGSQSDYGSTRGGGAAVFDYDLDGDEDLYVTHNTDRPNQLFRNDEPAGFVDVAAEARVASTEKTLATLTADLDNDGDGDLLLLNEGPNRIYRNDGNGLFADLTATGGFPDGTTKTTYSAAVADYDLDGDLDVYVCNWHYSNALLSGNELWRNDGDLHFTNVTLTALVGDSRETLAAIWHDLDFDGDADLMSVNEFEPDRVYRNEGDGTFVNVTYDVLFPAANVNAGLGMGVHIADADQDGLQDIYVTNFWKNNLFMNQGDGTFVDRAVELGCSGPTQQSWIGWGVEFLDVELDGDLDIYLVNGALVAGTSNDLYLNDGTGYFTAAPGASGASHAYSSRGAVAADFDLDGDQDLFVVNHDLPTIPADNCYYENIQSAGNHWLRVRTRGIFSNADGVGARVTVSGGGQQWIREVTIGSSFASSSSAFLTYGLGAVDLVDLTVVWPSGVVDDIAAVSVDRTVVIVEGQGTVVATAGIPAPPRPRLVAAPNPARRTNAIAFALDGEQDVRLGAYAPSGRLVREIFTGRLGAGPHRMIWDGRAGDGTAAAPGVYFLRLHDGRRTETARIVKLD